MSEYNGKQSERPTAGQIQAVRSALTVVPAGQAVHELPLMTVLAELHVHELACPPALVIPAGQATQALPVLYWLTAQLGRQ